MLSRVILASPTKGRWTVTKRIIGDFLKQDYEGEILLLIYNNSEISQELGEFDLPKNRKILLINRYQNLKSGEKYTSLGEIYNDLYQFIPDGYEILNHFEVDDRYSPEHVSKGVEGLQKFNCSAYKPYYSWFQTKEAKQLAHNLLEPSIFFKVEDIKRIGCSETTGPQFHLLINTLKEEDKFIEDIDGTPTLTYLWVGEVFKTSGGSKTPFEDYEKHSQDHGDRILTPTFD